MGAYRSISAFAVAMLGVIALLAAAEAGTDSEKLMLLSYVR
jgi:hypothetical protein